MEFYLHPHQLPLLFSKTKQVLNTTGISFEASLNNKGSAAIRLNSTALTPTVETSAHYHGNMFEYAGFTTGLLHGCCTSRTDPAGKADGFPVIYLYGPDANGNLVKLTPSYQLKSGGNRPGDGIRPLWTL